MNEFSQTNELGNVSDHTFTLCHAGLWKQKWIVDRQGFLNDLAMLQIFAVEDVAMMFKRGSNHEAVKIRVLRCRLNHQGSLDSRARNRFDGTKLL